MIFVPGAREFYLEEGEGLYSMNRIGASAFGVHFRWHQALALICMYASYGFGRRSHG
jgi:hypothetical protein